MLVEQHLRKQEARCGFGRAGPRVVGNTEGRSCCRAVGEGQPVAGPRADGRRVPACDALLPGEDGLFPREEPVRLHLPAHSSARSGADPGSPGTV